MLVVLIFENSSAENWAKFGRNYRKFSYLADIDYADFWETLGYIINDIVHIICNGTEEGRTNITIGT